MQKTEIQYSKLSSAALAVSQALDVCVKLLSDDLLWIFFCYNNPVFKCKFITSDPRCKLCQFPFVGNFTFLRIPERSFYH